MNLYGAAAAVADGITGATRELIGGIAGVPSLFFTNTDTAGWSPVTLTPNTDTDEQHTN